MDIKIEVELNVLSTMETINGQYRFMSVLMSGFEIVGIVDKFPVKWLNDISSNMCFMSEQEIVNVDLEFEVDFSDVGEINNISLAGVDINDIVSANMEQELKDEAKALQIQERINRGEG